MKRKLLQQAMCTDHFGYGLEMKDRYSNWSQSDSSLFITLDRDFATFLTYSNKLHSPLSCKTKIIMTTEWTADAEPSTFLSFVTVNGCDLLACLTLNRKYWTWLRLE